MERNLSRILTTLAGVAVSALSLQSVAQVSTLPDVPKTQETVRLIVPQVFNDSASAGQTTYNSIDLSTSQIAMTGNRITVAVTMRNNGTGTSPSASIDMPLGQFPPGSYEVLVTRREPSGAAFGDVGLKAFVVAPRTGGAPLWNHTDLWWDPAESGWGMNLMQHGSGVIFATWFVYGADRKATWFVVSDGSWTSPTEFIGTIYRTTGPNYADCTVGSCPQPFDPRAVGVTVAGTLVLDFSPTSANFALASLTIDGVTIQKNLQRQPF
jgi:hypothetical protein